MLKIFSSKEIMFINLFMSWQSCIYIEIFYIQAEDLFSNHIPKKISQLDNLIQVNPALTKINQCLHYSDV